jgi:hypothetical protein
MEKREGDKMANLQIKGIDDALYGDLKQLAVDENRALRQQALFLMGEIKTSPKALRSGKVMPESRS